MPFALRRRVFGGPALAAVALATLAAFTGCERPTEEEVARVNGTIVGGTLDTTHKGVVSLLKQVDGGYYPACSGTLLTQNLVLTAHHCVAGLSSKDGSSVECATTEFTATDRASSMLVSVEANVGREGLDPFRVAQVWVPEGGSEVCGRDIALLLLTGAGVPANVATPIEPNLSRDLAANEVFAAIGYGLQDPADETGETSGHRMSVTDAQVFCEGSACGTDLVLEGEFIADSPVCSGDSGGPALDKSGRVSGVTSRGDEKCTVGIYSSVSAWSDFIIEKTFAAASSGHYTPPAWAGKPPDGFDPGLPSGGSSTGGAKSTGGSSALPLAGGPNSSTTGGSGNTPVIDPLGLTCTGACPGSYVCWALSSKPPGICVPQCSEQQTSCPADFSCDATLGACLRTADLHKPQRTSESGCSVNAANAASARGGVWLGLLLLGASSWRRRTSRRNGI
jgi:hypothetical protein